MAGGVKTSNLFFRRPGVGAEEGLEPEPATDAGVLRRIDLEQYWDLPRTTNDWGGMTLTPWIEAALYRPLTEDHLSIAEHAKEGLNFCLLYTSQSPRDKRQSRMPSSA